MNIDRNEMTALIPGFLIGVSRLVPDHKNLCHSGCVKASELGDRKASCIGLIQRALRSPNCEHFHVSQNGKDFRGLALVVLGAFNLLTGRSTLHLANDGWYWTSSARRG